MLGWGGGGLHSEGPLRSMTIAGFAPVVTEGVCMADGCVKYARLLDCQFSNCLKHADSLQKVDSFITHHFIPLDTSTIYVIHKY